MLSLQVKVVILNLNLFNMFTEVVKEYKYIQTNIDKLIELSGYRVSFICNNMDMDKTSFYLKRKKGNFSSDELENLLLIIRADELEDKALLQISLEAEKEEGTLTLKEALSESTS